MGHTMKIGILTFHNAHNYGAVMQAYALRTILRRMGHEAWIINYRNQTIENNYLKKLRVSRTKCSVKRPKSFLKYWKEWRECRYKQSDWGLQCDKFNDFINSVLLEGNEKRIYEHDLTEMPIDGFICGSDQIWNASLTGGLDKIYFLDFREDIFKISYGASRYYVKLDDFEKEYFREKLQAFDAVSVREEQLAIELSKAADLDIKTVLDPSLLLDEADYILLEKPVKEKSKFVLAYYLCEDEMLDECARKVAEILALPLIEIHFYRLKDKKRYQIADCGPEEFLTYFHTAEYILTNSFHGVAFSVIFNRPFYAVYNKDARKDNFLKKIGLEKRKIYSVKEITCDTMTEQFKTAKEILNEEKKNSIDFIEKAISKCAERG